jgi:hypothetical protein
MRRWSSEGSAVEPQQNQRKREGNLRQCHKNISYQSTTIVLTTTPEAHDVSHRLHTISPHHAAQFHRDKTRIL